MIVDTLRRLLVQATTTPVIIAYQNGPRPKRPYMTVWTASEALLPVSAGKIDADGMQAVVAHGTSSCEVQCFADDAGERLAALSMALRGVTMIDAAADANVAIDNIGPVRSVPILRDGAQYEPRAILEFDFRALREHVDDVGFIDRVVGDGHVAGADLDFDASVTITTGG